MSYCRAGDDSDVYVYASKDGWETHVAHNRGSRLSFIGLLSKPWLKPGLLRSLVVRLEFSELNSIPLKSVYKGQSFTHTTAAACASNLVVLRNSGLQVPLYAIDRLTAEVSL